MRRPFALVGVLISVAVPLDPSYAGDAAAPLAVEASPASKGPSR